MFANSGLYSPRADAMLPPDRLETLNTFPLVTKVAKNSQLRKGGGRMAPVFT